MPPKSLTQTPIPRPSLIWPAAWRHAAFLFAGWSLLAGAGGCNFVESPEAPPPPRVAPTTNVGELSTGNVVVTESSVAVPLTTAPTTAAHLPPADPSYHVDARATLGYLASDELGGRVIGSPGLDKAADRIADSFARLGLKTPPGQADFFQRFSSPYSVWYDASSEIEPGAGKDWSDGQRPGLAWISSLSGLQVKEHSTPRSSLPAMARSVSTTLTTITPGWT